MRTVRQATDSSVDGVTQAEARLAEFDRRRDELLREWEKARKSGRLLLYVDVRRGEVMDCGEVDLKSEPWTEENP